MRRIKKGKYLVLAVMLLSLCACGSEKYPAYFQKIVDAHEQDITLDRDYGLEESYQDTYSEDTICAYAATVPRPDVGEFDYNLKWMKAEDGTVLDNISFDLEPYIQSGTCGTGGVFYEKGEVTIVLSVMEWGENVPLVENTLVIEFNTDNPAEYVVTVLPISSWFEGAYRVADKLCINNGSSFPIHQIDMETKEVYICKTELETAKQYAESMSDALGKEVSLYWLVARDYVDGVMIYSGTVQEKMDSERLASIYLAYEGETLIGVMTIDEITGKISVLSGEDLF